MSDSSFYPIHQMIAGETSLSSIAVEGAEVSIQTTNPTNLSNTLYQYGLRPTIDIRGYKNDGMGNYYEDLSAAQKAAKEKRDGTFCNARGTIPVIVSKAELPKVLAVLKKEGLGADVADRIAADHGITELPSVMTDREAARASRIDSLAQEVRPKTSPSR